MPAIPEGFGLVEGRSRENARKVIDAAKAAGLDASVVRTTAGGYLVPVAVLDAYETAQKPKRKPPTKKAPATKAPEPTEPEADPASEEKE